MEALAQERGELDIEQQALEMERQRWQQRRLDVQQAQEMQQFPPPAERGDLRTSNPVRPKEHGRQALRQKVQELEQENRRLEEQQQAAPAAAAAGIAVSGTSGRLEAMRSLYAALSEAQKEANNRALCQAARNGQLEEVRRLLFQAGANVEA
eukprot:CAMPEP_0206479498 /NCGR_PEP_ID=MMETSP0324_2-20121206/36708_1 /ASSEMBLY_ACC=CAM_ASM_000836 /TAXON_ID=2866 /ORGANISM="Crypthecodinium cohnii, Strain Seligo" /LENGTH=151 /DNA_ID=CAMNT_0053956053 /DNA_START=18 /DNA_END=469 /DNA_ORIENTATION=-